MGYYEKKYEPPPTIGNLPEYVSNKYDNKHNPQIPYREVKPETYDKVQPYQHYFPKYTTPYYEPYKAEPYKAEPYKEEPYKAEPYKTEDPYKKEEPYKAEDPYKKEETYKAEEPYKKEDPYKPQ